MATVRPITIVGGGLAGLTLGIGLRRQGVPVTVWEAGRYPRHRVCGEFISGRGQDVLGRLGLLEALREAGAVWGPTAAFFLGRRASPVRTLSPPALCLSRLVLDALLVDWFRGSGGDLRENTRWSEQQFGEGIVRADGRRRHPRENGVRWFGIKVHARNVPLAAHLEMHGAASGYVGFCRLKDGEANICALLRRTATEERAGHAAASGGVSPVAPARLAPARHAEWSALHGLAAPGTALRARLAAAEIDPGSFCSVAGICLRPHRAAAWSECCIGDALTMTPPVTGNGMSMAFEAAEMAIAPLADYSHGACSWEAARRRVATACDRAFTPRLAWAQWLQWMMFARLLRGWPGVFALRSALLWRVMFTHTR